MLVRRGSPRLSISCGQTTRCVMHYGYVAIIPIAGSRYTMSTLEGEVQIYLFLPRIMRTQSGTYS
jgi:hypothetical protein